MQNMDNGADGALSYSASALPAGLSIGSLGIAYGHADTRNGYFLVTLSDPADPVGRVSTVSFVIPIEDATGDFFTDAARPPGLSIGDGASK
jgi:hypothetical protein